MRSRDGSIDRRRKNFGNVPAWTLEPQPLFRHLGSQRSKLKPTSESEKSQLLTKRNSVTVDSRIFTSTSGTKVMSPRSSHSIRDAERSSNISANLADVASVRALVWREKLSSRCRKGRRVSCSTEMSFSSRGIVLSLRPTRDKARYGDQPHAFEELVNEYLGVPLIKVPFEVPAVAPVDELECSRAGVFDDPIFSTIHVASAVEIEDVDLAWPQKFEGGR